MCRAYMRGPPSLANSSTSFGAAGRNGASMGTDRERRGLDDQLPLRRVEFHILLSLASRRAPRLRHHPGHRGARRDRRPRRRHDVPRAGAHGESRPDRGGGAAARPRTPATNAAITTASPRPACGWRGRRRKRLEALTRAARLGRAAHEGGEMSGERLIELSERWFRLLVRPVPAGFLATTWATRVVETYRDRARDALEPRRRLLAWPRCGSARSSTRCATVAGERARPAVSVAAQRQLGPRRRSSQPAGCCARRHSCSPIVGTLDRRPRHCSPSSTRSSRRS